MPEGINIKHLKLSDLKTVQQTEYYYNYLQIIFPTFVINVCLGLSALLLQLCLFHSLLFPTLNELVLMNICIHLKPSLYHSKHTLCLKTHKTHETHSAQYSRCPATNSRPLTSIINDLMWQTLITPFFTVSYGSLWRTFNSVPPKPDSSLFLLFWP